MSFKPASGDALRRGWFRSGCVQRVQGEEWTLSRCNRPPDAGGGVRQGRAAINDDRVSVAAVDREGGASELVAEVTQAVDELQKCG